MGKQNSNIRQGLAVAVILLFLGVAIAPSINANVSKENELVEITTEICGIDGVQPHMARLTKHQVQELEQLFEDTRERLDKVETREEAEEIFKEAVVELDRYGLLGGLSVRQAQRLVTGEFQNEKTIKFIERNTEILEDNENLLCLIAGEADRTIIADIFSFLFGGIGIANLLLIVGFWLLIPDFIEEFIFQNFPRIGEIFGNIGDILIFLPLIWSLVKPFQFGGVITFGTSWVELSNTLPVYYRPSKGWVKTMGLNGVKEWNGEFYGHLGGLPGYTTHFIGVRGFTGIKISDLSDNANKFLGYARHVKLNDNHP